jgi:hypothetical protein
MTLQNILKEKKGTFVDVRSTEEFMGGNVAGSINIPLPEIPQRLEELKTLKQPLISVLCLWHAQWTGPWLSESTRNYLFKWRWLDRCKFLSITG